MKQKHYIPIILIIILIIILCLKTKTDNLGYGNYYDCIDSYAEQKKQGMECTECQYITPQILQCEQDVLGDTPSSLYIDTFGVYCSTDVIQILELKECWKNG